MIDTHCHLTYQPFRNRVQEELDAAQAVGVRACITVGTSSEDSDQARRLAEGDPRLWFTAGIHPLSADERVDWGVLRSCGAHPRCVAWGELGLDNHYEKPTPLVQRAALDAQLDRMARWSSEGLSKPVVIHCRKAFDDLLPILRDSGLPRDRFVFHCFTGTPDEARRVLDFGAWISFTGVVTYRNAPEVADAARLVPEDRIMAETDAPFLSPEPMRTAKPNRPAHSIVVARHLARLRGVDEQRFLDLLDDNAVRFFGLPPAGAETPTVGG
jgi:TatD DNase family protein